MKEINIDNTIKKEKFQIDFRTRIFVAFSYMLDSAVPLIREVLLDNGFYNPVKETFVPKGELYVINVSKDSVVICFSPKKSKRNERIQISYGLMDLLRKNITGFLVTQIVVINQNSYVVGSAVDTEKEKKTVMDFFFPELEFSNEGIAIQGDGYVSRISIKFTPRNEKEKMNLDSTIVTYANRKKGQKLVSKKTIEELCEYNYRMWRSTVSDAVIDVMKKGVGDE